MIIIIQNLYQFVLGNGVVPPFTLCTHLHDVLPISSGDIKEYKDVLLYVHQDKSDDLPAIEVFSDDHVKYTGSISMVM